MRPISLKFSRLSRRTRGSTPTIEVSPTTTRQKLSSFTTCQRIPLKPTRKSGSFSSRARRTHSKPELNRNFDLQILSSTKIHKDLMSFLIECIIWMEFVDGVCGWSLWMEFYLWLIKKFYLLGSSVFSVFAGVKFTCAMLVSVGLQFRSVRPKLHTYSFDVRDSICILSHYLFAVWFLLALQFRSL